MCPKMCIHTGFDYFTNFNSFFYSYFSSSSSSYVSFVSPYVSPHSLSICFSLPPRQFAQVQPPQTHCHQPTLQSAIVANPRFAFDPRSIAFYFSFFLHSSPAQLPAPHHLPTLTHLALAANPSPKPQVPSLPTLTLLSLSSLFSAFVHWYNLINSHIDYCPIRRFVKYLLKHPHWWCQNVP